MKKILILLIALFLVGCGETKKPAVTEEPKLNEDLINEVNDYIYFMVSDYETEIIDYSNASTVETILLIETKYAELTDAEKEEIVDYEKYLDTVVKDYEAYVEEQKANQLLAEQQRAAINNAIIYLNDFFPVVTNKDLDIPVLYEDENGQKVTIGWRTTDPQTLTSYGKVIRPRGSSAQVTLTGQMICGSVRETYTKNIRVAALGYEDLPTKPVFAYFYTNTAGYEMTEIERNTIDVYILSFATMSNGEVFPNNLNTTEVLSTREAGKRVLFSLNNKAEFKTATATASGRTKLVNSIINNIEKYHFDGIDIDWEYPETSSETESYALFIQELYTKTKARNSEYLVTSAMYGGSSQINSYKAASTQNYLDYIHLMTYDLNDPNLTSHLTALSTSRYSSISAQSTVTSYVNAGVNINKLVIGGAFYGKIYSFQEPNETGLGISGTAVSITYSEIKRGYLPFVENETKDYEYVWDEGAQAPYLYSPTDKVFITYDDYRSLLLKAQYVKSSELGGMMFWELGYEDRRENDLLLAIYDGLKK